jgi:hypothetical protein
MRKVYDSTTVRDIPASIERDALVAGYVDGNEVTYPALHTYFPRHTRVSITVTGRLSAHVIDCEAGDVSPDHAAAWAHAEHSAGRHPTIYMPESLWDDCKQAVRAHGLDPDKDVSWWVAWYEHDGIPDGAIACQNVEGTRTHHWDVSDARDYWPGVDSVRKHAPAPPADNWTERMIHNLPTLAHGAHNPHVRTVQGLLQARGFHHVDVDGVFGPATEDAVHALQAREDVRVDGIVGRDTWVVLVTGARA